MTLPPDSPAPRQRRRGADLEAALLDAAWDELVAVGFAKLTMESVASRSRTGVAVLYRRWANKDELAMAAFERHRRLRTVALPDTGSLRGDLVAALTGMGEANAPFFTVAAAAAFAGLLAAVGLTPAEARDRILGGERIARMHSIYERAEGRGELELSRIPQAVLNLPFDLVRHDLFMNLDAVSASRIREIVDDIFLPLAARYGESATG